MNPENYLEETRKENQLKATKIKTISETSLPFALLSRGKVRDIYPKFFPFFSFLERTSRLYPEVLSGKIPPTQALFPADDPLILKKVYEMTPKLGLEETYLHLVKEWLLDKLPSQAKIIEIGGGQGILTEILYPALGHLQGEYVFTDIGTSFLKEASQRWKSIKSQQYDVSQDPRAQNLKTSSFDALVGFNVIHATQNIGSSLRFCSSLVKPGGWILLVENAQQQIWIDLIYGLTPEWWNYEDGIRSLSPLLTCDEWEKLLADFRFSRSWVFPASGPKREKSDTALIAIQKEADDE